MHTLFRSIANGLSWDVVVRPLIQVGWLWGPWVHGEREGLEGRRLDWSENLKRKALIFHWVWGFPASVPLIQSEILIASRNLKKLFL